MEVTVNSETNFIDKEEAGNSSAEVLPEQPKKHKKSPSELTLVNAGSHQNQHSSNEKSDIISNEEFT